ncbi:hypothetical protein [Pedobacter gandavensis]|uniref:DUF4292 domain-containing protein n=1 Tax=Pedobacter gandavensis TaxID=2679963 RepID=A0ABR6EX22_9SPHI|nr:hypothetical protein [Pedobacter gandavensis]MBB2149837.1 hypothetical protein [Pedobacter gandavensis]
MKHAQLLFSIPLLLILLSCNQQPKHPQANLIKQSSATAMTDESILQYVDSINAHLAALEKQSSLIFLQGEQSMYVEKYNANGKPVLYEQNLDNKLISNRSTKYYLKNDSLLFLQETIKTNNGATETRHYFRNNIAFKKEQRTAPSYAALKKQPFLAVTASSTTPATTPAQTTGNEEKQLKIMEDAIGQKGPFALFFEGFIDIPEESIIQLKGSDRNGYTANVIVRTTDALIDSLQRQPSKFKNEKLNFKWEISDKEAVYVPVGANITSAKGLNK